MSDSLETFSNFAWRLGLSVKTLSRKLRHPSCPQNFEAREGPTGRIVALRPSPELEQFLRTDLRRQRS
jgi:hypothetical protein